MRIAFSGFGIDRKCSVVLIVVLGAACSGSNHPGGGAGSGPRAAGVSGTSAMSMQMGSAGAAGMGIATGMAGASATAGIGASRGMGGASGSAGTGGSMASANAGTGGGGGTMAALPPGPGCQDTLAGPPAMHKVKVSNTRIDYMLDGAPGSTHLRIALLLFNGSSLSQPTQNANGLQRDFYTPEELGDVFFTDPNGVQAFTHEASFGQVTLAGSVVGWVNVGATKAPAMDFQTNREQYAAMVSGQIDLANYDVAYIVGVTDGGDPFQVGWGRQNTLAGHMMGIVWMINSEFWNKPGFPGVGSLILPSTSWAHELHHTLDIIGHALALDCGKEIFGTGAGCQIHAYGNPFSAMGGFAYSTHDDALMKQRLGWLATNQMTMVTTAGVYPLCPLETVDGQPKGLAVPLTMPVMVTGQSGEVIVFDRLQIEYRRELGFDRYLSRLAGGDFLKYFKGGDPVDAKGVLISLGYQSGDTDSSVLLDTHPLTAFNASAGIKLAGDTGKFADAILTVGETFELSGVVVKVESLTADGGIQVRISYK
jgi:hypothetical protein